MKCVRQSRLKVTCYIWYPSRQGIINHIDLDLPSAFEEGTALCFRVRLRGEYMFDAWNRNGCQHAGHSLPHCPP